MLSFLTTVKEVKVIAFALYVPQHKGRGTYCFWCGSVGIGVGVSVAGCLSSIERTDGWILIKLTWIHYWDRAIKLLDFGDLDHIFKVTGDIRITNLDQNRLGCTLSCE